MLCLPICHEHEPLRGSHAHQQPPESLHTKQQLILQHVMSCTHEGGTEQSYAKYVVLMLGALLPVQGHGWQREV
jgi:hypothetical protein